MQPDPGEAATRRPLPSTRKEDFCDDSDSSGPVWHTGQDRIS